MENFVWLADIITVVVLVLSAWIFSKKGFIKCVYKAFSIVAVIGVLFTCTTPLYETFLETEFSTQIDSYIATTTDNSELSAEHTETAPGFVNKQLSGIAENTVIPVLSDIIKKIICILILYFVTKIVLFLLFRILTTVFKLPLLGSVNSLFGAVVGLVSGIMLVFIVCGLISLNVSNMLYIREIIDKTFLLKLFYDNNLLFSMFI